MTQQRASIFDDDELDISDFTAPMAGDARKVASPQEVRRVSEAINFRSRDPVAFQAQRRYRTGRNIQLNIKVRQETLDTFNRLCDRFGWVQGETLERALAALERDLENNPSSS